MNECLGEENLFFLLPKSNKYLLAKGFFGSRKTENDVAFDQEVKRALYVFEVEKQKTKNKVDFGKFFKIWLMKGQVRFSQKKFFQNNDFF